jgi:hypothetical protein
MLTVSGPADAGDSPPDSPDAREQILGYLQRELIGPAGGEDEVTGELPYRRYLMGTLYAQSTGAQNVDCDSAEIPDSPGVELGDESEDEPVVRANDWRPSSLGLSFFCQGNPGIECRVWAARYVKEKLAKKFKREVLAEKHTPLIVSFANATSTQDIFGGLAQMRLVRRALGKGTLFTVSLVNTQKEKPGETKANPEKTLNQVGFSCFPRDVTVSEYPSVSRISHDEEQQELNLMYNHKKIFAVGHGCAAEPVMGHHEPIGVCTQLLPHYRVFGVKPSLPKPYKILDMGHLATAEDFGQVITDLRAFVKDYGVWVEHQRSASNTVPAQYRAAAGRIAARLVKCEHELSTGIDTLEKDERALKAFRLMNQAMTDQMNHPEPREKPATWHPFQLAFILRVLSSISDPISADRSAVDLLWFPTGGGKTEAYLGIAAFTIFYRRLKYHDGGAGTAIITRYTLRLLTAQQFERTSKLICACERIRRAAPKMLGGIPITLGLWVGGETTPNTFQLAIEKRENILGEDRPINPFQISQCPWCRYPLIPTRRGPVSSYGIRADNHTFEFFCPSQQCEFHDRLPISVVDEDLYVRPPSMVVGTVDKFARLSWEELSGALFGSDKFPPPDLIIQDELHLLSGPLGTTVAIYESAIEALCSRRGVRPKIIAATATIRRAPEQIKGLFGREHTRLFPPSGLSADDAYFATVDHSAPGRVYAGIMSQSHTIATSIVNISAALLQAPLDLKLTGDLLDAYWTLVIYHNSLRELGRTVTLARDDIPSRLTAASGEHARRLDPESVQELTGNVPGYELPRILERAEKKAGSNEAIDLLACTNMLSVGVDITRLGLMLVNGQPKTTSEYIQATSRIGRSVSRPGLVLAMYSATRPRDRSHYESFLAFHSAFYRSVEPTSVTPFSIPSRKRALHAALVILVRHGLGHSGEGEAGRFRKDDPAVQAWVDGLKARISLIDPVEAPAACADLDEIVEQWHRKSTEHKRVHYRHRKQFPGLLTDFGDEVSDAWQTLHSMRNVDRVCSLEVVR